MILKIPPSMKNQNSIIRVTSGSGIQVVKQDYDNEIIVETAQSVGELRVLDKSGNAVSTAYVKVYAASKDGTVSFHKDGYTDVRGRFNYRDVCHATYVDRLAIMVVTEKYGSAKLEI